MTNYEQMAEKMYAAYSQQAGGLTFDGRPLPSFSGIGLERQTCWKAAAEASKMAAPVALPEPDSYLFQHEDTGQTMFVDVQQVEWGFEANNPRLHKVSGVYTEQQVRELLALGVEPPPQADARDAERWVSESDSKPLESDGEVFVRFSDGTFGTGWASYWHGASDYFVQWDHPDPDEDRTVTHWMKPPAIDAAIAAAKENK